MTERTARVDLKLRSEKGDGVVAKSFTFFAEGDRIEVRIVEFETRSKAGESDAVWLDSKVTAQAGAFLGSFKASFTTDDLVAGVGHRNRLGRGTVTFRTETDHFALIRTYRGLETTMRAFAASQTIKTNRGARK